MIQIHSVLSNFSFNHEYRLVGEQMGKQLDRFSRNTDERGDKLVGLKVVGRVHLYKRAGG